MAGFKIKQDDDGEVTVVATGCFITPTMLIIFVVLLGLAAFALAPDGNSEVAVTCAKNIWGTYVCN